MRFFALYAVNLPSGMDFLPDDKRKCEAGDQNVAGEIILRQNYSRVLRE
jgi:hypothetical protein